MERFVKGDVVVVPFPFSDLTASKKRPALVLASTAGADIILSQITSEQRNDAYSIKLTDKDFQNGTLNKDSNIRTNKLFTADKSIICYKAGSLCLKKIKEVQDAVIKILIA